MGAKKGFLEYVMTCLGIIFLLASPSLVEGMNSFAGSVYTILEGISRPGELSYYSHSETRSFPKMPEARSVVFHQQMTEKPLFPYMSDLYSYSFLLLAGSLLIAGIAAYSASVLVACCSSPLRKFTVKMAQVLEALPDVFFIFCIQLVVVWIYKQTGWEIAAAYSTPQHRLFFLPLITLSIVPAIYLFRLQMLLIDDEKERDYVLFAKSKGLGKGYISLHHLFRNTMMEAMAHVPALILLVYTNLIVLELLFHSEGVMSFIIGDQPASSRAFLIIMLMTPFFAVIKGMKHFREKFYEKTIGGTGE
ncbi:ABC transporter permease subunit [Rossellomorea aquimaris]|uniref:ABC transporter permease subunit n=1 Tax=Rossellomorea aquimaris TaxID=189382 RepID=UPI001CD1F236|nr:ABC transporter permease subunit [Rossellomorea aquimaris]MCA1055656.1 ABC transporter permease subunit [Rossellomorea aquimaris]